MSAPFWRSAAKAVVGCLIPFLLALGASMLDGDIRQEETVIAFGMGLSTGLAVYAVPNSRRTP